MVACVSPTLRELIITAYHSVQSCSVDAAAVPAAVPSNEHQNRCTLSHLSTPSPYCYCDAATEIVNRHYWHCTYLASRQLLQRYK